MEFGPDQWSDFASGRADCQIGNIVSAVSSS